MNQQNEELQRETMNYEGYDYEIHDLTDHGQIFPRFPFLINIPFICFTPNQLHSYMTRYFQMLRELELQNIQMYNPVTSIPFSIYCGFCNMPHIIDRPMSPAMIQHLTSSTIIVPQWIPLFLRPPAEESNPRQD